MQLNRKSKSGGKVVDLQASENSDARKKL